MRLLFALSVCISLCSLSIAEDTTAPATAPANPAIFSADFSTPPIADGWELGNFVDWPYDGAWQKGAKKEDECFMTIRTGYWMSPAIPVEPSSYYRVRASIKAGEQMHWGAIYFAADGNQIIADDYDGYDWNAEPKWIEHDRCVRTHPLAKTMRIRFHANTLPVNFDHVTVTKATAEEVAQWADLLASKSPICNVTPAVSNPRALSATARTLRDGGKLRIVMLGDSICNDTSNSLYETLLMRHFPKARIEVLTSVRGGTGCTYYKDENRVQEYVLQFNPDLLIIAGISHGNDASAIQSVIRQVRAKSKCDILVLNDYLTPLQILHEGFLPKPWENATDEEWSKRVAMLENFQPDLRKVCAQEDVALVDMRTPWEAYVKGSWKPQAWFMRDAIHGNSKAKQVGGRLLERALISVVERTEK